MCSYQKDVLGFFYFREEKREKVGISLEWVIHKLISKDDRSTEKAFFFWMADDILKMTVFLKQSFD